MTRGSQPTKQEVVSFWGTSRLSRWPRGVVTHTALPPTSKRYLVGVGLPQVEMGTVRFGTEHQDLPLLPRRRGYRVIGYDYVYPLCLIEPQGGKVVEVAEGSVLFVNTTVDQLGTCLYWYGRFRRRRRFFDERDEPRLDALQSQVREADPACLGDREMFWPSILEQLRDGLL